MKLLRSKKGMSLVELSVTMLLLLLFMGVATTVMSGAANSAMQNIRLDRAMSIAQTVLQGIEANVGTAGTVKLRNEERKNIIYTAGEPYEGPYLEYENVDEDSGIVVIGLSENKDLKQTAKEANNTLGSKINKTVEGYLEKRYYVPNQTVEPYGYVVEKDGYTACYGAMYVLAPGFYMNNRINISFRLIEAEEAETFKALSATVQVLDRDGNLITEQTRTMRLTNLPTLGAEKTSAADYAE